MKYDIVSYVRDIVYKKFKKSIHSDFLDVESSNEKIICLLNELLENFIVVNSYEINDDNLVVLLKDVSTDINYCMKINKSLDLEFIPIGIGKLDINNDFTIIVSFSGDNNNGNNSILCIKNINGVLELHKMWCFSSRKLTVFYYDAYLLEYVLNEFNNNAIGDAKNNKIIDKLFGTSEVNYFSLFGKYINEKIITNKDIRPFSKLELNLDYKVDDYVTNISEKRKKIGVSNDKIVDLNRRKMRKLDD